ncbi:unnamed protein product [Vitrella brassicaformis CCMP3155]|uniref:Radical SAM core domain-containing protein n=2 Tax=Vitrella brassicaformis TaxID=1169539 RepID=A0A0G4F7C0_VITBC|nr:unnamed protein product [Vitrella brassicaformis CCMP3155]|eukprot:CEM07912.1 unnamed protein product [Vitrella brassicaformis CCMP3155]
MGFTLTFHLLGLSPTQKHHSLITEAPAMALQCSPRLRQVAEVVDQLGFEAYRTRQILELAYKSHYSDFMHMKVLPRKLRYALTSHFSGPFLSLKPVKEVKGDFAHKVLFECRDGVRIEAVSLDFHSHRSLCISSQAGCAFSCSFCATGKIGLKRQLTADEITDQVLYFMHLGQKVDTVSFMGMGEPLANPKVFDALKLLTDPDVFNFSSRRLNVSTIGILPGIEKLTREHPQVNLVFSLHSPFPEERNVLVPTNRIYPFQDSFALLDRRIEKTGRRIWIAYLMLKGRTDTHEHADSLVQLIKERPFNVQHLYHVNLLPYNTARGVDGGFERLEENAVEKFARTLSQKGISWSYRNSFGAAIDAACGQLHGMYEAKPK